MARGSKIAINRAAYDEFTLAVADGLFAVASAIVANVRPPDAPPYGEGLPKQGGALAYVNGKKVAGFGLDGKQPRVPRAAHISRSRGIVAIAGWGFPARFNELGTIKQPPRPFFTPARDAIAPQAPSIMRSVTGPKLPRRD